MPVLEPVGSPRFRSEITLGTPLHRDFRAAPAAVAEDDSRTATLSFCSEEPVERYFLGERIHEVLDVPSMDVARLNGRGALLLNHDPNQQIGGIVSTAIGNDGQGRSVWRAVAKFSRSQLGQDVYQDVKDGIRGPTSFAYELTEELSREKREGETFVRFKARALEVSLVGIPADATVGVGRQHPSQSKPNTTTMPDPVTQPAVEIINEPTKEQREKIAKESREEERKRFNEIDAAVENLNTYKGIAAIGRKAKEDGLTVAQFNDLAIKEISTKKLEVQDFGLSRKEKERYSFAKSIRSLLEGKRPDGVEWEVSQTLQKQIGGREPLGIFVPLHVGLNREYHERLQRTALTTVGSTTGADIYPDQHMGGMFIEALRPMLIMEMLGARIITVSTPGAISIPRHATTTAITWQSEATATTESNPTYDDINLTPHEGSAYTAMSRRLMANSDPGVEMLVRQDLNDSLQEGLDTAFLTGSGTNRPEGVTIGAGGAFSKTGTTPTRAELLNAEADVATANALKGSLHWVTTPAVKANMRATKEDSGSGQWLWTDENVVLGYPALATTLMTTGNILFGNFNDYLGVIWNGVDLLIDPYSAATSRHVRIHINIMADGQARHGGSFSLSADT